MSEDGDIIEKLFAVGLILALFGMMLYALLRGG